MLIGDIKTIYLNHTEDLIIYQGLEQIYPVGLTPGTTFDFNYTGGVQSIELPKGKYKLQCWGAQGGTSAGSSNGAGSKGGYSEGVLTLTEKTTLYVFVGGKGSRGSSTSLVNGGWNGGGASVGYTSYNSGGTNGYSYPACGGGATDISTVTSSMSYSSGRTNRSSASLLARCIVAGGGAGGSYRYTSVTTTSNDYVLKKSNTSSTARTWSDGTNVTYYRYNSISLTSYTGKQAKFSFRGGTNTVTLIYQILDSDRNIIEINHYSNTSKEVTLTIPNNAASVEFQAQSSTNSKVYPSYLYSYLYIYETTSSTSNSSGYSNQSQQGGGTSGRGQYPGTQSAGGSGSQSGGFGYGANQPTTGNRYNSGAGGGGWYGGGSYTSDSTTSTVNRSGGGSGFVNTAANASYRPSGYTGLQFDSGTTTAGNTSFESVSGGTETGHSGNGYARITVIE